MGSNNTQNKILVMVCINFLANLVCHSVYSVLAAFFPQEGKAKGMSDDRRRHLRRVAAVSIVCSPFVGRLMSMHGKVWIYILGLLLVSVSTISFSVASLLPPARRSPRGASRCASCRGWAPRSEDGRVRAAQFFSANFGTELPTRDPTRPTPHPPTAAQLRDHRRHRLRERLILPRDH